MSTTERKNQLAFSLQNKKDLEYQLKILRLRNIGITLLIALSLTIISLILYKNQIIEYFLIIISFIVAIIYSLILIFKIRNKQKYGRIKIGNVCSVLYVLVGVFYLNKINEIKYETPIEILMIYLFITLAIYKLVILNSYKTIRKIKRELEVEKFIENKLK